MGWATALIGLASSAFSANQQRKARKDVQALPNAPAAELASEADAEGKKRDAQRAAARKKGLMASVLAGENQSGGGGGTSPLAQQKPKQNVFSL